VKYPLGRSRIVYIGSTNNVLSRIPVSVGERARSILDTHGIRAFAVFIVSCHPLQKVRSWSKLERALLIRFRERYGKQPLCNTAGKRLTERGEFRSTSAVPTSTAFSTIWRASPFRRSRRAVM